MKNFCQKTLAVFALMFALTSSAFAGIMWTEVAPPPPPPPPPAAAGIIQTDVEADGIMWPDAPDAMTDMGLMLLGLVTRF